jgi:hypothetical protein
VAAALDTVGSAEAGDVSLALVKDLSRVVTIADAPRAKADGYVFVGASNPASGLFRAQARARIVAMAASGDLVVPMAAAFAFDDAPAAFAMLTSPHPPGKIALTRELPGCAQVVQQGGELGDLGPGQAGAEQVVKAGVHDALRPGQQCGPGWGQREQRGAPVARIGVPLAEAASLQPVEQLADAARGHPELRGQLVHPGPVAAGDRGHRLEQDQREVGLAPQPLVNRRRELGPGAL